MRFHGSRRVDASLVDHFLDPDPSDRGALLGLLADSEGGERVVALAEYARLRDPAVAEVAFTVAEVLPDNAAMLGVFRDAGFEVARKLGGGEVEVSFPIAPTESFRERVEERDHVAVAASLKPFFAPA